MRDFLIFLSIGWIFLVFRTALFRFLPEAVLRIEPSTIIVVYLGLTRSLLRGGFLSILLGYMTDLFSGGLAGLYTIILTATFLLAKMIRRRFYVRELLFQMGVVFFLSLAGGMLMFVILLIYHSFWWELYSRYLSYLIRVAFFNSILSPFILLLFRKIDTFQKNLFREAS